MNGCDSIIVTTLMLNPTYSITDSPLTICNGDSISIYGIFRSATGTYYDSLTTTNSCDSVFITNLTVNPLPSLSIAGTDATCNVANGATTEDISSLAAGIYNVTVTDSSTNICTAIDSVTINEPPTVISGITTYDVSCNGGNDGFADLTVSGLATPYTYSWSNGSSSQDISSLLAGIYTVDVTDANGCTANDVVTINEPAALVTIISGNDVMCYGDTTGTVDLTVFGGTTPYSYLWSNGATTQDLTGLPAGTYSVFITDSNGCTEVDAITLTEPVAALTTTMTVTDPSCAGTSDGQADLDVTGGTPTYTYSWSTGATSQDLTGLSAGNYYVTVTDANNCVVTDSAIIIAPAGSLTATISQTDVTCNGLCDGTATASISGGTIPYVVQWNTTPAQTDTTVTGLCPGTYTVNISDANNCQVTPSVTITEPVIISITVSATDASCGNTDGTALASVSGGTMPYSYLWTGGSTDSIATGLDSGTYIVTVSDTNGCGISDTVVIGISAGVQSICMVTVDSTSTKNVVVWEKPITTSIDSFRIYRDIISVYTYIGSVPYAAESYFTDATNGVNPQVTSYRYKVSTLDSCGNESPLSDYHETIHLTVNLGTPPAMNLIWDNYEGFSFFYYRILRDSIGAGDFGAIDSVTNSNFTYTDPNPPSGAMTYAIEVVHPAGCTADKTKNFNSAKSNTTSITIAGGLTANTSSNPATQGICDGDATVTASGGVPTYTYLWSSLAGGQTTATATNLCAGDYSVLVTDGNGDTLTVFVTVTEVTGIHYSDEVMNDIKIYPNPSHGVFILEMNPILDPLGRIVVYNMTGSEILNYNIQSFKEEINLSNYPAGLYHLQVITKRGIANRKLILE